MRTMTTTLPKLAMLGIALIAALAFGRPAAADPLSIGVIQYNAKASMGGWTTDPRYYRSGDTAPLDLQIQLIVDKINDPSNPSPVQFIALEQAGTSSASCGTGNRKLISCALADNKLQGWNTILSQCAPEQTELAYSSDWELVPSKGNPLVNGYVYNGNPVGDGGADKCWAPKATRGSDHGRPYNMALFRMKAKPGEQVLFVLVHMPHQYPDCTPPGCAYGGKYNWDVPQFKQDIQTVVGTNVNLKNVRLIVAGDMNDLGNDDDPKKFVSIFGDFGNMMLSEQVIVPPLPTCCQDSYPSPFQTFFDRVVTNAPQSQPRSGVMVLKGHPYPLNAKKTNFPAGHHNEEHKAIYAVVTFP